MRWVLGLLVILGSHAWNWMIYFHIHVINNINIIKIPYRWVLCASGLTDWCVTEIWDIFESPRWRDGLHPRTYQSPRAQRQTGNTEEGLWWVIQQYSVLNRCLACIFHFPLNALYHCIPRLCCKSHTASSIWFLNDPWLGFTHLLVFIDRFLFWLLIGWSWPDASWDTDTGHLGNMPPDQARHICNTQTLKKRGLLQN